MRHSLARRCLVAWTIGATVLVVSAQSPQAPTYPQKTRTFHSAEEFARATGGKVRIERTLDPQQHAALRQALTQVPSTEFTVIGVQSPSVTWIGTRQGAVRLTRNHEAREYFAGRRWLPDDHVTGIGFDGAVTWIETPRGFARIEDVPMTLAGKSRAFVDRIQARHNRWGLTASSHLRVPGDLSTNQMVSSDNDGLWTAMYVAAECLPLPRHRRGRRARERAARHAGHRPSRGDHRQTRVSCPVVHQRQERRCSRATASGTTRRTRRGAGRATRARTRSSVTTSSIRSISSSWRTKRRSRHSGPSSTASRTTSWTTTTS